MYTKKQLGDLLVEAGIITSITIQRALERQKNNGGRLGEILEEMGVITQEELIKSLSQQLGFKRVSRIATHQFCKSLLDLVPAEIALMSLVFPLKLSENTLSLAVYDPFDLETIDLLAKRNRIDIVPVLATRDDILEAVSCYYKKAAAGTFPRQKLLIVDSDPKDAKIVELSLMNEGLDIRTSTDPLNAFAQVLEYKPDMIICASIMPQHDGFSILNELRADFRTELIPFIMLTSSPTGEDEKKAVEANCIDYIPKPLNPMQIIARVKRAFRFIRCMEDYGIPY